MSRSEHRARFLERKKTLHELNTTGKYAPSLTNNVSNLTGHHTVHRGQEGGAKCQSTGRAGSVPFEIEVRLKRCEGGGTLQKRTPSTFK